MQEELRKAADRDFGGARGAFSRETSLRGPGRGRQKRFRERAFGGGLDIFKINLFYGWFWNFILFFYKFRSQKLDNMVKISLKCY